MKDTRVSIIIVYDSFCAEESSWRYWISLNVNNACGDWEILKTHGMKFIVNLFALLEPPELDLIYFFLIDAR